MVFVKAEDLPRVTKYVSLLFDPSHYVSVELSVKVMLVWRLMSHPNVSLNELLHKSPIFPSSVVLAHTE